MRLDENAIVLKKVLSVLAARYEGNRTGMRFATLRVAPGNPDDARFRHPVDENVIDLASRPAAMWR